MYYCFSVCFLISFRTRVKNATRKEWEKWTKLGTAGGSSLGLVEVEGNNLCSIKVQHVQLDSPDLVALFHHVATALDTLQYVASSRIWTWCRLTFCCCTGDKGATYFTIYSGLFFFVRAHFSCTLLRINITVRTCKRWNKSKNGLQVRNTLSLTV